MGVEFNALRKGSQDWHSLAELMQSTSRELGGASVSALPPRVQSAATTFFTRWEGYALESSEIAEGFSGALKATQNDFSRSEDATDRRFSDLDGRLGPAR